MSALDDLKSRLTVDIDQLAPCIASEYGPFCDMTSNQALIAGVICAKAEPPFIKDVVQQASSKTETEEDAIDYALDMIAVRLAKGPYQHITGRVHAQLRPRNAYDTQASLIQAHRLVSLFAAHHIPMSRLCLKIPSTGPGLVAAAQLEKEGIRTLATTLFSVDQALAARQAGCLYIAPYFNELGVHFDPSTWVEYGKVEEEHPMSGVIREIVERYKGEDGRPLVMPASIVTAKEAMAIGTLGVDHITISAAVIVGLAENRDVAAFRGQGMGVGAKSVGVEVDGGSKLVTGGGHMDAQVIDFLAGNGKALDASIAQDESVQRRLDSALKTFGECEEKIIEVIKKYL